MRRKKKKNQGRHIFQAEVRRQSSWVTSLVSVFLRLSFVALRPCLFKLCSLQAADAAGHFDAKKV